MKIFGGNSSRNYILEKISKENLSGYILKDFDGNPGVTCKICWLVLCILFVPNNNIHVCRNVNIHKFSTITMLCAIHAARVIPLEPF